jgi:nucleotidyltransferase AbiEii toxin of type IV toxin-antitoxin system
MTGEPEHVPPLACVVMPDVEQHGYRAYPLIDHIADKVAAMFELHGQTRAPSTRYKDLVDVVAIVLAARVGAESQMAALRSEENRRGLRLPGHFTVPDRKLWERGYAAEAERSLLPTPVPSMRPSPWSGRSSTRSSTAPPAAPGTPLTRGGRRDAP